jgi:transposase InsO family protein
MDSCSPSWGRKKQVFIITYVDRRTRCIVNWAVDHDRTEQIMQHLLDTAPQAGRYFSDAFPTYGSLIYYPGRHQVM